MKNSNTELRYWLDQLVAGIVKNHPEGKIIVSSGISPSGPYHVGHAREILTAEAVVRGLLEVGREVEHLHFVDAHDALRKRYPYLPESYEAEAGKPLVEIPAPDGKSKSYAHQYFADYSRSAKLLGINMQVVWTNELYDQGKFADLIKTSILKRDEIDKILKKVSGRSVEKDWLPIQILDETNKSLRTAKYIGFDPQTGIVNYLAADGQEHQADIRRGQVKLDWRIDWPARWVLYGVQVEGFGREHATKGGSYDTGKAIAKEIFGVEAPLPVPYEIIALKGDTKKMSS
ncbi:MAG: lysine--tRNA ligase, partial [Enterovibrio sp.]